MTCIIWLEVKQARISDFGSAQTLTSRKKPSYQSKSDLERSILPFLIFYREAQVLATCRRHDLDNTTTDSVSFVISHSHLYFYLKGIRRILTFI